MLRNLAIIVCLFPFYAHAFELAQPADCTLGEECFIQNYVDHNPAQGGNAYQDFTCGTLGYDGHKGTDIAVRNESFIGSVNILAAADGVVEGVRDGQEDGVFVRDGAASVKNIECGNGVRIKHVSGWVTQYCHLQKGSVQVQSGNKVKTGDVLGKIGMSGEAEFPHLHFQAEQFGQVIDPFVGHITNGCAHEKGYPMWNPSITYTAGGVVQGGFSTVQPTVVEVRSGQAQVQAIKADDPAIIFWIELYGVVAGDHLTITLKDPYGTTIAENSPPPFEQSKARGIYLVGKRHRGDNLPAGTYHGIIKWQREERTYLQQEWKINKPL